MKDPIIYAVADVHGRADLLDKLLAHIEADARSRGAHPVIYFLGDIVDRGPESLRALEIVRSTLERIPGSALHIGNHDRWFLESVVSEGEFDETADWLDQGGEETLLSFMPRMRDVTAAMRYVRTNHEPIINMLSHARLFSDHGSMVFCHAGIKWDRTMEDQDIDTLTWIRAGFLNFPCVDGPVVVHGHTIFREAPFITDNRISLDCGAYKFDRLTALRVDLNARQIGFVCAKGRGALIETDEDVPFVQNRGLGTVYDRINDVFDAWMMRPHIRTTDGNTFPPYPPVTP